MEKTEKEIKKIVELLVLVDELQISSQWLKDKIVEKSQVQLGIKKEIPNKGIELAFTQASSSLQAIGDILHDREKKSDAQLWLESTNIEDLPDDRKELFKYLKELMNGKTPTEIKNEMDQEIKNVNKKFK